VVLVERTHAPDFRLRAFHMHSRGEERDPCKHVVMFSLSAHRGNDLQFCGLAHKNASLSFRFT
jgi:hypothetical protein